MNRKKKVQNAHNSLVRKHHNICRGTFHFTCKVEHFNVEVSWGFLCRNQHLVVSLGSATFAPSWTWASSLISTCFLAPTLCIWKSVHCYGNLHNLWRSCKAPTFYLPFPIFSVTASVAVYENTANAATIPAPSTCRSHLFGLRFFFLCVISISQMDVS